MGDAQLGAGRVRQAVRDGVLALLRLCAIGATGLCGTVSAQAGLLGLYPFEGNGNDISGNNRHATTVTATIAPEGYEGQAYSFNGAHYIRLPIDIRNSVTPRLTMGAWVWLENLTTYQTILSNDSGNFCRTMNVDLRGTNHWPSFSAFEGSTGVTLASDILHYRRWVFQAVRYDHTTGLVVLTVDGQNFVSGPFYPPNGNVYMDVGRNPDFGNYLKSNSKVDNVFVFNEFLSDQQLQTIRTLGVAGVQAVAAGQADGSVNLKTTVTVPAQVRTGDLFEYRVRVNNQGSASAALAATVRASLPAPSVAELAVMPDGCAVYDGELSCALVSLGAGQQTLIKLPFIARAAGPMPLTVTALSQSWETDPSDDFASAQTTIGDSVAHVNLRVPVPVRNASFEEPAMADGTYTRDHGAQWAVPGWVNLGDDWGVQNNTAAQITGGEPPDGINVLWSNYGATIVQTLPTVLTRGLKYTLTVAIGDRLDITYGGYRLELWAGSEMLASQQNLVAPPSGGFVDAKLTYVHRRAHPMEGQPLEIRMMKGGLSGVQTLFDRVRLDVTALKS